MSIVRAIVCFVLCGASTAFAVGPKVHIVVGAKAEAIEQFAADELAGQLKKLFDAKVTIGDSAAAEAERVIFLGTRDSCSLAAELDSNQLESGYVMKTLNADGREVFLIAGVDGRGVLDGVYGYGRFFGVRAFRFGDLYPTTAPSFVAANASRDSAHGNSANQEWDGALASPFGLDALTSADIRDLFRQLAKMEYREIKWNTRGLKEGRLFRELKFPVDGDTAGRAAFKGAKFFENADLYNPDFIERAVADAATVGIQLVQVDDGEATRSSVLPQPSELDEVVINLSRPGQIAPWFDIYLTPVCGEGVAERVEKAFSYCRQAAKLIETNDARFGVTDEKMLLFASNSADAPPAWWGEVRTNYLNAMNEMYRANTRAREGGRAFTLYYARRFEFGFEYMNVVEALRKAAIAKKAGNQDEQIAELEKALDSITNACNAMAAVARSQSDRGIIAVMNEYGYRSITTLLEEADAGN